MQDADIEQKLRRTGVPDAVTSHVMKHGRRWYLWGLAFLAVWLPVVTGGYWLGSRLWLWLEQLTEDNAILHAKAVDAIMYQFDFGLSLLIGLFAWIFISTAISVALLSLSRLCLAAGFITAILDDGGGKITDWIDRKLLDRLSNETDPERYIRKSNLIGVLIVTMLGLPLAFVSAVTVLRDIQAHSVLTSRSYINSPFFPWPSPARDWSSATSVATGCSFSDRERSATPHYKVTFPDGAAIDVGRATQVSGGWLSAVEAIDREVRKSGATFSALTWLWHEPFHPLCIQAFRAHFPGPQFERVKRLLRLPG